MNADQLISRPLILVGAPRSGTTMLFQTLSSHPELWSLYCESHGILDHWFPTKLEPGCSSQVTAADVDAAAAHALQREFFDAVGNLEGERSAISRAVPLIVRARLSKSLQRFGQATKRPPIRIVEKTPINCLRIGMMKTVFPDAMFVFVVRDPRASIASIYHGWRDAATRFRRNPMPPGFTIADYSGPDWCFGMPPGWEEFSGKRLIEVSAFQWIAHNEACLRDLPTDESRVITVSYEDLSHKPGEVLDRLAAWAGLDPGPLQRYREKLPVVNTLTRPSEDKWRRFETEIDSVADMIEPMSRRLGYDLRTQAWSAGDR
jgi:hypothetical protein